MHRTYVIAWAIGLAACMKYFFLKIAALLLVSSLLGWSDEPEASSQVRLTRLSLKELANLQITSVSKKEENYFNAASAVYVLTQEDIHRSGATSIPEALRMVPGMNVARINANKWAISARGFNGRFANKLLVLMDGRTVYTPLFSGVYWDVQDTLLEDIDRIEVIRGPGAALWGANAVNGVINVITKDAKQTQGALVTGGSGTDLPFFAGARYGGQLAPNLSYRIYGKFFAHDDFKRLMDGDADDEWHAGSTGFRLDWLPGASSSAMLQGAYYGGTTGDLLVLPSPAPPFLMPQLERANVSGGHLLGRWAHEISPSSDVTVQLYYDRAEREINILEFAYDTLDVEVQQRFELGERHEFVYGTGYRLMMDEFEPTFQAALDPPSQNDQLFSAFLQDQISLVPDRLTWTLGSKFEHNDYTGFEVQPNTRLLWTPHEEHSVWAAISKAVRTPSRAVSDLQTRFAVPTVPGVVGEFRGSRDFDSEDVVAYEVGYRVQPAARFNVDLAAFYNEYDDLNTNERLPVVPGAPAVLPLFAANGMEGETYGAELVSNLEVTDTWRLMGSYSLLKMNLRLKPSSNAFGSENAEGDSPQNQFHVRSYWDLPHRIRFDTAAYYVDNLSNQNVPSYIRLDVRLGWRPTDSLELELVFQNLLDDRHPEFGSTSLLVTPTQIERSVYGRLTWAF